jgi:hypothetical protein
VNTVDDNKYFCKLFINYLHPMDFILLTFFTFSLCMQSDTRESDGKVITMCGPI